MSFDSEREEARERARQKILNSTAPPKAVKPPHRNALTFKEPVLSLDESVIGIEYDEVAAGEHEELFATLPPPPNDPRQEHLNACRLNIDEVCRQLAKLRDITDSKELLRAARDLRPIVSQVVAEAIAYEREHNKLKAAARRNEARAHQHQFVKDVIDDLANEGVFPTRPLVAERIGRRSLSPHEERVRQLHVQKRIDEGWIRDPRLSEQEIEESMFQYHRRVQELQQGCEERDPPFTS